ncbi:MAG: acetyl-CoA carboxylase biotin carboxyl carrier protein [Lentisphaeria bacterium]
MRIDQIKEVAELMKEFDLTEIDMESEELKLTLRRGSANGVQMQIPTAAPMPPAPQPAAAPPSAEDTAQDGAAKATTIDSPIVGTFYAAASPDADPYIKVGDQVTEDTVVCIVEAMKVMNEIKAEKSGIIKQVLVENANPVEYGQPLFEIE